MRAMGATELLIILVIVLLLFGASKLPELGRSLGSGLSNFKQGLKDGEAGPTPQSSAPPRSLPESSSTIGVTQAAQSDAARVDKSNGDG